MKLIWSARATFLLHLLAAIYTLWRLAPGLRLAGIQFRRLGWIVENPLFWVLGWWLWLAALVAWLVLMLGLLWSYLPSQRFSRLVQGSLIGIAATLLALAFLIWMTVLPAVGQQANAPDLLPVIDALVLSMAGGGLLLAGIATAWVGFSLWQLDVLPRQWVWLLMAAGLLLTPSPFLFPNYLHLFLALACWLLWCGYLATRSSLPKASAELP